jgi:heat shock protein 5
MVKNNHYLGGFDLAGIPPAPRGVASVEVKFEIDANGILKVTAEDKGSGSTGSTTITSEKGRLSEEDIARMVQEAEQFAEEDRKMKERIDARHIYESYLYGLMHTLEDGDKKIASKDKKALIDLIDENLEWMEENTEAEKEDYDEKQAEVERIANPILRGMYTSGNEEEGDFADEL